MITVYFTRATMAAGVGYGPKDVASLPDHVAFELIRMRKAVEVPKEPATESIAEPKPETFLASGPTPGSIQPHPADPDPKPRRKPRA